MAPMFATAASPQKRPLSMADYDAPASKKQRQFYHRHHSLQFKQQTLPGTEPALVGHLRSASQGEDGGSERSPKPVGRSQVDDFLDHSIISICEKVAARDGIVNPSIERWALETFRAAVEECMRGQRGRVIVRLC
jgi:hypothetical protein